MGRTTSAISRIAINVGAGCLACFLSLFTTPALAQGAAPAAAAPAAAAPAAAQGDAPAPSSESGVTVKTIDKGDATKPQDAPGNEAPPADAAAKEPTKVEPTDAEAEKDKNAKVSEALEGNSPVELPGKTYYFIGARYRGIVLPKFMQNVFADGGKSVYVNGFGPEFAIRKDGFEYNLSTWLAFYNADNFPFKGKGDDVNAWELLSANLKLLYITSDFLWSHEFTPEIALNYGLGVGLGFVFGTLNRVQSTPTASGQKDPAKFVKCTGPSDAVIDGLQYCDTSNDHYGNYSEPNWANGGSKPIVFPWLALQTGLRFKPSKNVVGRFDLGFGTSGFFFGAGVDYGL